MTAPGSADSNPAVHSVDEWLRLTEIHIPHVRSKHEMGVIYTVVNIDGPQVPESDCHGAGLVLPNAADGQISLPTVTVEYGSEARAVYRLPLALSEWATTFHSPSGANRAYGYPCLVEFKIVSGMYVAEVKKSP